MSIEPGPASAGPFFTMSKLIALKGALADADRRVREVGANNHGPDVERYLRASGLGEGYPWCAAFVTFHLLQAGMPLSMVPDNSASACNWLLKGPGHRVPASALQPGDLFGWCATSTWKGHIGFVLRVYQKDGETWIETIEGNTGPDGGRDGDGVYRKRRKWRTNYIGRRLPAWSAVGMPEMRLVGPAILNGAPGHPFGAMILVDGRLTGMVPARHLTSLGLDVKFEGGDPPTLTLSPKGAA
jgi:hypothetical protein